MRALMGCLVGAALLAGCASREVAVVDPRLCPPVKAYSKQEQAQMARDLDQTPPSIQKAFIDYGKMRDQARACRRTR
jgi:outer membrane murein-binding lipoprotein Lpp